MNFLIHFLILILLLIFSAFFSAVETAIFSLTKIEKRRLQQTPSFFSKLALYHLEHPRQTLATILIANLIVNTLAAALVTILIYRAFGPSKISIGVSVFTILLIFFGEILPKTFAVRNNERVAKVSALLLQVFVILLAPLRWLVRMASDKILGAFGRDKKERLDSSISQSEIKTMVKIGEEEGVLDSQERYMLQKLLELGERPVKNIMTPRIDLIALNVEEAREQNLELIQKHHFSHFPVYQNTIDNLIGVVSVQQYVLHPENTLQSAIHQPLYVPDAKRIDDLLAEFRQKNQSFAVCLDEYGGTAGIVTLEDILEEIFGEFYDEYAKVENPIRSLGHHEYLVEAKLPLADFNEFFSFDFKAKDATTVGGLILEKLGELPEKGRTLKFPECDFVIHDVIRHKRIRSLIVRPHL